ncbi:MAG: NUDIX domain-containing protein [Chloroflexi bacterium]|nr:NUDIX domain-containing protein [Chloroflexota bacterium]MBU1748914.1 NUDIX domain-containing protein [Chloroflexota bacterium]
MGKGLLENPPLFVVVALVLIRQGDDVLLVRQSYDQRYWSLPGGMMEHGESVDQAAIREVKEETGLDVRLTRVVGIYSKPADDAIAITFEGKVVGGELHPAADDVSECCYFPLDRLPEPIRDHLRQRIADYQLDRPQVLLRTQ